MMFSIFGKFWNVQESIDSTGQSPSSKVARTSSMLSGYNKFISPPVNVKEPPVGAVLASN